MDQIEDFPALDFYASDGSRVPLAWRPQLETVYGGVYVVIALATLFFITLIFALWQCSKRKARFFRPGKRNGLVFVIIIALTSSARVVYLSDPFGWLDVLHPVMRAVLYAFPHALIAFSVAVLIAVWYRLVDSTVRLERSSSKWAIGRYSVHLALLAICLAVAAVVTTLVDSETVPVFNSDMNEPVATIALTCVRACYGCCTLALSVFASSGLLRLLRALVQDRVAMDIRAVMSHSSEVFRSKSGYPGLWAGFTCSKALPQSAHVTFRRSNIGIRRQAVAAVINGMQPRDMQATIEEYRRPSAQCLALQPAFTVQFVQRRAIFAVSVLGTLLATWLTIFAWCMHQRWLDPGTWLAYMCVEHIVELGGAWVVLLGVWPSNLHDSERVNNVTKEGSDKLYGDGDWAPLRGRSWGGRHTLRLDTKLKEVWEDESILAYLAMLVGVRPQNRNPADGLVSEQSRVNALWSGLTSPFTIGWSLLFRNSSGIVVTNASTTAIACKIPDASSELVSAKQVLPVSTSAAHDGSSLQARFHVDRVEDSVGAREEAPQLQLPQGTVLEFSLDALLSSPALRAMLLDGQARELEICHAQQAALLAATAHAITESAKQALGQMRTLQDNAARVNGVQPPLQHVVLHNPLRNLTETDVSRRVGAADTLQTVLPQFQSDIQGAVSPQTHLQPCLQQENSVDVSEPLDTAHNEFKGTEQGGDAVVDEDGLPPSFLQWLINEWPHSASGSIFVDDVRPAGSTPVKNSDGRILPAKHRRLRASKIIAGSGSEDMTRHGTAQIFPPVANSHQEAGRGHRNPHPVLGNLTTGHEDNGYIVDMIVWAREKEKSNAQAAADLTPSDRRHTQVRTRRSSLDSGKKIRSGQRDSEPQWFANGSMPLVQKSTTWGQELPQVYGSQQQLVKHDAGKDGPCNGNPLRLLAVGMNAKEERRIRDQQGGSMAQSTGAGSVPSAGQRYDEQNDEWDNNRAVIRHERVLQTLANLKARGKKLPPARELELQQALDSARATILGGTGTGST